MAWINLEEAIDKQRIFHNYLLEHRIFMTDNLRKKFGTAIDSLSKALTSYSIGKDAKDSELKYSGNQGTDPRAKHGRSGGKGSPRTSSLRRRISGTESLWSGSIAF
jgi:hypothetical protein